MSCVLSAARAAASWCFVLLFGGVVVLGSAALPARANEPEASAAPSWCVARSGEQLDCTYDDFLTCSAKALFTTGYCVEAPPAAQPFAAAEPVRPLQRHKPVKRKPSAAAHKDKLFREFVRWKEAGGR